MWSRKGYQLWRDAFNDGHVLICDSEMIAFYQTRAEAQCALIVSRHRFVVALFHLRSAPRV
jgi:hypothetical protein